jgi:coatomer protein complex subunit epsilon
LRSRKYRLREDGRKIAYWSIWQSHGLGCEWYVWLDAFGKQQLTQIQGGEKYQQAFYVFEELAQAPSTSSSQSLVSQAVAEIHLGRLEEAEAALQEALAKDPKNPEIIVNTIVLNVIAGKDAKDFIKYVSTYLGRMESDWANYYGRTLSSTKPDHHFLTDLEEKSALFDKAATKYSAKVAA